MGTFTVPLQILGLHGQRVIEVQALVDTGATHTFLPGNLLVELGIDPTERVPFQLADERTVECEVGEARVRLDGRERTTLVVFGPDDAMPLLGATTLGLFNFAVDPMRRSLMPVPGLLKTARPTCEN